MSNEAGPAMAPPHHGKCGQVGCASVGTCAMTAFALTAIANAIYSQISWPLKRKQAPALLVFGFGADAVLVTVFLRGSGAFAAGRSGLI